ncbi:hypothetical protein [Sinorhizobium meliloti]|uniref:hypothetical protein n=1 Tax=Rhizobium meliloti TaxID=382 RepID=UPI00307DB110
MTVKIKFCGFSQATRSKTHVLPVNGSIDVLRVATDLQICCQRFIHSKDRCSALHSHH